MLEQAWIHAGRSTMLTCEPSSGPVGNLIRQAFKGRVKFQADLQRFDQQMAYLFAADRFDHLYNDIDGIVNIMQQGTSVISTRYYFSSFAYHCTDDSHWDLIHRLNQDFPEPDLLIYLRNPVAESMRRLQKRTTLDSYEQPDKLTVVAENYERILRDYRGKKLILDATAPPDLIHATIIKELNSINGS